MPDDPTDTVELCVQIRDERPASYGVVLAGEACARPELIWLPKSEIRLIHRGPILDVAVVEIPRWLAEKEGLVSAAEPHDPNQGELL